MRLGRRGVLWLTLTVVFVLAVAGVGGFVAVGGASRMASLTADQGLWTKAVAAGPSFGAPKPVLDPDAEGGAGASADGVERVLTPLLADPRLGTKPAVSVIDVETGTSLFGRKAGELVAPASTTKIVTAAAVLAAVGPYHRFRTRVVAGSNEGEIVLVGGGDPTLATGARSSYPGAARLDELAKKVKAAGPVTKVIYDASLFEGAATAPGWEPDDVAGGFTARVSALTINGGRLTPLPAASSPITDRATNPARYAASAFARLLGLPSSAVAAGKAPDGAKDIAHLDSPPVQHLVEQMLTLSDNVIAESLLRQVAVAKQKPASFEGAALAVKDVLRELGIDVAGASLVDGSGLSRLNRLSPQLLTAVLRAAAGDEHPQLRGILAGLPVAAYSGTLIKRFRAPQAKPALGEVRAKTGTLNGVSSLSGVVVGDNGQQLAFAVLASGLPVGSKARADAALDRVAAALAACGCT